MATKKGAAPAKDVRPFFKVELKDPLAVHRAIAEGNLPLNVAPINLSALERWAHENCKEDDSAFGLNILEKVRC